MQLKPVLFCAAGLVLLLSSLPAPAQDTHLGALSVRRPAAPATLPGQNSAVVYLSIDNEGTAADRLVSATSPAAGAVSLHRMTIDGGVMRMREIDGLPIAPSATVSFKAGGGYHLMMTGLKKPLVAGDSIPLTLVFERAGKLQVAVHVGANAAQLARPTPESPHGMSTMPGH